MSNSLEDDAAGCLGKLFGVLLVIHIVGGAVAFVVIKAGEGLRWASRKIAENATSIISIVGFIVALLIVVVISKTIVRTSKAKNDFLRTVVPPMKSLEAEALRQRRQLDGSGWPGRLAQMKRTLANAGA